MKNTRQYRCWRWCVDTFGVIATINVERASRLAEEAVELAQSMHVNKEEVLAMVERVYANEPGDPFKEIGQVGLCLDALAENVGVSVDDRVELELNRISQIDTEEWHRRQNAKAEKGFARAIIDDPEPLPKNERMIRYQEGRRDLSE
jgi:hypothetical protein